MPLPLTFNVFSQLSVPVTRAAVVLFIVAVAAAGCAIRPLMENVHDVVPGVVVRSAQLSPQRLTNLIQTRKLGSVLNLRGAEPGATWYEQERAVAAHENVPLYDFGLASWRDVPPGQASALIELMRQAPKPLLIHCRGGADRTGLASALYLYAVAGEPAEQAASALSARYFHLSFTSARAMDRSYWQYVESPAGKRPSEP